MASVKPFEEIVPLSVSAASSSSSPLSFTSYDVFINHCGADVKFTLATSIYEKLTAAGFSVFLDVDSLQQGDVFPAKIEEAMSTVSLHIVIFSIKYAESPWCLAELSFMLKTGKPIIPVFYHVQPSDLRWVRQGKGIYAAAFSLYENQRRYSPEKAEEWKVALERASFLNGIEVKDNKGEGMLLKNIVNMASKILPKAPLLVARKPVGLGDIVLDFERNTPESAENEHNVRIVGIVGMGGAGKTTLAKELYNTKSSSFQSSSFVFEVRDAASKNALHKKQKKLLEDLGVKGSSFDNIEEGKAILASRLRSVHALIVLDDVDHENQLDALLPGKDCLASGSLVMVTTRDLHLLAKWGSTIYRMKALNPFHAKHLFCWHAFLQFYPEEGFQNIVGRFLNACNGLPLSLEVFGGLVYGRSKDYWESQLDKISRILPEDIKGRLSVSYNALDEEQKEMFMDVACFFIGRKPSLAIEVWNGLGWSGLQGWETLVNKCLVNVDKYDEITMHDHLRDLGRDLAGRHTPSRVWLRDQMMNIQKQARGGRSIRGIDADRFEYTDAPLHHRQRLNKLFELIRISNRCFGRPPPSCLGLKLFTGREDKFVEYFGTPSGEPVWLSLNISKRKTLQSWSLRKLRVLELNDAECLRELWDNSDPPLQLRKLSIKRAYRLQRIPKSIGRLEELKRIVLTRCSGIKNLPEEFCGLRSLEWLDLSHCSTLSSLPSRLGDLINLRYIDLTYCMWLQILPDSFKQLRHLQHLGLFYCVKLTLRSDMLENIRNLEYLNFYGCMKLEQLPNQITDQVCLKELDVGFTGIREIPSGIGDLRELKALKIGSPFLVSLPSSLDNLSRLTELCLRGCKMLNSLPDFAGPLNMLNWIRIEYTGLSTISITEDSCPRLETLELHNNDHLIDIQTLPTSVRRLQVSNCRMLKKIMGLHGLENLQFLSIEECPELNELPGFANLHSIKEVRTKDCDKVVKMQGLDLPALVLPELNMLKSIQIYSTGVSTISIAEDSCPSLEIVRLGNNHHLTDIQTLPTSVRSLQVEDCKMLKKIMGLRGLANLQFLYIKECPELNELPGFADLHSIKEVGTKDCDKVVKMQGLDFPALVLPELNMLKSIQIYSTGVSTISIAEYSCPSLEFLTLCNNDHLTDIQTLPTSVQSVEVIDCKILKKIVGFRSLANLQFLSISACPELNELPSFADLHSLKEFEIKYCDKIVKIEGVEHCSSLETLEAVTLWKSQGIQSLEGMEKLKRLFMVAESKSALQPCIQTIKKWPGEMVIFGRAVSGAKSVMDSLSFPTLTMGRLLKKLDAYMWSVESGKTHTSGAVVACFLVNSFANSFFKFYFTGVEGCPEAFMPCRGGKWVIVGVLRQERCSSIAPGDKLTAIVERGRRAKVERGMLVAGEEGRVLEAFTHFWALFI